MPRKAAKTEKPPLLFLERTLGGGRIQNVPEVRAALNAREFFPENQEHSGSALHSWVGFHSVSRSNLRRRRVFTHCLRLASQVSPQFDASAIAALPVRRGRRGQASATSILDGYSHVSARKSSVCKYPPLTFEARNQTQPKPTLKKRAPECPGVSDKGKQPHGRQLKKASSANDQETPSRKVHSIRKRNVARCSDGEASSSRSLNQQGPPATQATEKPAEAAVTPALRELSSSEVTSFGPPPDVDTPNALQESSSDSVPAFLHVFLPQPVTPPGHQQPDSLVPDTPERNYGLKVTWRRRMGLMLSLKASGRLSDSHVSIRNWCREQVG